MCTSAIRYVLSAACIGITIAATSSPTLATTIIAADNASNYDNISNPWVNNSNGGFGFSKWSISRTGSGSTTIASSPIGASSWEMNGDDSSSVVAKRNFPNVGRGSISMDLDANTVDPGGSLTIIFLDSNNFPAFELAVDPSAPTSNQDYLFYDGTGAVPIDTGIVANGDATHLDFHFDTSTNTYVSTLTQTGGGSYTAVPGSPLSGGGFPIDQMWFIDQGAGTPIYINNLTVVPVPAAAIAAIPLIGLIAIRRLRLSISI